MRALLTVVLGEVWTQRRRIRESRAGTTDAVGPPLGKGHGIRVTRGVDYFAATT